MGKLFIGTSGYKYDDWEGVYYPEGIKGNQFLSYYGKEFNTVEINFTYYTLPNPFIFQHMLKKVDKDFIFSIKAHCSATHKRDLCKEDLQKYFQSVKCLSREGRLGCILLQFPYSFKYSECNIKYLKELAKLYEGYNPVVEFRNISWMKKEVVSLLESLGLSFCNVDEPNIGGLLPPTAITTSSIGYIRFHGRGVKNWWNPEHAYQRYDYSYTTDELLEWVPRIKRIAKSTKKTFIYFNNHYRAKAVKSAQALIGLLKDTSQN